MGDYEGLAQVDNNIVKDERFVASQWLNARNYGGLSYPREQLVEDVKKMDTIFIQFHEESDDGLKRTPNVTNELTDILVPLFPKYNRKMLKRFALSRTIIRM